VKSAQRSPEFIRRVLTANYWGWCDCS